MAGGWGGGWRGGISCGRTVNIFFQLYFNKNLFCAASALTLVVIRGKGERCQLAIMKFHKEVRKWKKLHETEGKIQERSREGMDIEGGGVALLELIDAMTMCPRTMCPRTKSLGCSIPRTMRPLDNASLEQCIPLSKFPIYPWPVCPDPVRRQGICRDPVRRQSTCRDKASFLEP